MPPVDNRTSPRPCRLARAPAARAARRAGRRRWRRPGEAATRPAACARPPQAAARRGRRALAGPRAPDGARRAPPPVPVDCESLSDRQIGCSLLELGMGHAEPVQLPGQLLTRESGWNSPRGQPAPVPTASRRRLPRLRRWPSRSPTGTTNPATQIKWGLMLHQGRYGTPVRGLGPLRVPRAGTEPTAVTDLHRRQPRGGDDRHGARLLRAVYGWVIDRTSRAASSCSSVSLPRST